MPKLLWTLWREEVGQDLIEYTLLIAFLALVTAGVFSLAAPPSRESDHEQLADHRRQRSYRRQLASVASPSENVGESALHVAEEQASHHEDSDAVSRGDRQVLETWQRGMQQNSPVGPHRVI